MSRLLLSKWPGLIGVILYVLTVAVLTWVLLTVLSS